MFIIVLEINWQISCWGNFPRSSKMEGIQNLGWWKQPTIAKDVSTATTTFLRSYHSYQHHPSSSSTSYGWIQEWRESPITRVASAQIKRPMGCVWQTHTIVNSTSFSFFFGNISTDTNRSLYCSIFTLYKQEREGENLLVAISKVVIGFGERECISTAK